MIKAAVAKKHTVNEFSSNVERHRRELLIHCYRMLGSLPGVEDAVQEALLPAWRYRDSPKERRAAASKALPRGYEHGLPGQCAPRQDTRTATLFELCS
jgi:hypothetical protein